MPPVGDFFHRFDLEFFRVTPAAHDISFTGLSVKLRSALQGRGRFMWPNRFRHPCGCFRALHWMRTSILPLTFADARPCSSPLRLWIAQSIMHSWHDPSNSIRTRRVTGRYCCSGPRAIRQPRCRTCSIPSESAAAAYMPRLATSAHCSSIASICSPSGRGKSCWMSARTGPPSTLCKFFSSAT